MIFFVTVIIYNVIQIFVCIPLVLIFFLAQLLKLCCMYLNSRDRAFLKLPIFFAIVVLAIFFPIFFGLVNFRFSKLRNGYSCFFVSLKPRFFGLKVFYKRFLMANASCSTFCRLFAAKNLLVYFSNWWKKVEANFDFGFDGFQCQMLLVMQFLVVVLYLYLNQGLKSIAEKTN